MTKSPISVWVLISVLIRTDADAGSAGFSLILVETDREGFTVHPPEKKMGLNASKSHMLTFENVRVPLSNTLGEEGKGFKYFMQTLDNGRISIGALGVGIAQGAYEKARQYAKEREQFGKPLAAFQALQFKIADMNTELVAARQMVRLAAFKLDTGDSEKTTYCAMAKRFATDVGFKVCDDALQIHGGYGYIKEYPLERHFRDVRVHQILEGTNEIMRVIIARRILAESAGDIL